MATQREIAKHLDTNEHAIRELVSAGVLPAPKGRGGYSEDVCRLHYIRHLRKLAGDAPGSHIDDEELARERQKVVDSIDKERARLAAENADKVALENRVRRRELVPAAELGDALATVGGQIRSELESVAGEMKRKIPHLRATEVAIVRQVIARCSDAIAAIRLNDSDPPRDH